MSLPDLAAGFQSLPLAYRDVICLAQDRHKIKVMPLQLLVGGWSGAVVYLVSVSSEASNLIEHCILKLSRRGKSTRSDEITRHNTVIQKSTLAFARDHIAELVFERVENAEAMAIFYRIAGQSLLKYRPLSSYERQSQLETIFERTDQVLLNKWNADATFRQAMHPQKVLETWLGFRLEANGNIERFLREVRYVDPDVPGFLVNGHVYPNPLLFARTPEPWGEVRTIDVITGFIHGDLNTNNILVSFGEDNERLDGYYLIDFALFKEGMPLLYDQRYLEISYLMQHLSQGSFARHAHFLTLIGDVDVPDPHRVPIEASGISGVIAAARGGFANWLQSTYPSLYDDLWAQYWLAGVAAGLSYCHKIGLPEQHRLAGLLYAAANLKRFAAMFSIPRPKDVQQLYDESEPQPPLQAESPLPPLPRASHNLPHQVTRFIGRQAEVSLARELLLRPDVQMVTFTGPGGTGKTRLSLEVASGLINRFDNGVFFVALGDATEVDQVLARIAQELQVRQGGGRDLLQCLKDYVRDLHILLVLDNFEQLLPAAPLVAELLAVGPGLKVLVTSRIRLNLRAEHELPVPPLKVPLLTGPLTLEQLLENEAVRLFAERARAASPGFRLDAHNAEAVARICQRLDGLPLAIELAAARVKVLPPQAILDRLDERLKLLTGGSQDLPDRQKTLRSTLEWSYSLLQDQEKILHARLGVFVGGFGLEAAEAVCNPSGDLDVLEGISSLINNSLLKQEETWNGAPRFGMLETIREYALERLAQNGEMALLQKQHARYFARIVTEQAGRGLFGPNATYWLNWLQLEYDNVLATLVWTQSTPEGMPLGPDLVGWLNWFWYRRGYFNEGRLWTERILNSPSTSPFTSQGAMVTLMSSLLAMWQGDLTVAEERATRALGILQQMEDESNLPWALMGTGVILINRGRDREAHALLKEAQALFKDQENPYMQATALVHLGNVALGLGDPMEAGEWLAQAHRLFQEIGEEWGLAFVLNNLGEVARVQGNYEQAGKYYVECEKLLRATGDQGDLARLIHSLGYIALHQDNPSHAEERFRESLAMFRRLGNKRGIAECIAGMASLRARENAWPLAAQLLGAAENLLGASGAAWWPADRVEVEHTRSLLRSGMGKDAFDRAWKSGQSMTLGQALALVSHGV